MTAPDRPIFIIGAPRSGLSLLAEQLGIHPELAWVSDHLNRWPARLGLARRNRLYDLPLLGRRLYAMRIGYPALGVPAPRLLRRSLGLLPFPTEPWGFWTAHLPAFRRKRNGSWDHRSPVAADMSASEAERIRETVACIQRLQARRRFVSFYGMHPRIDYLGRAFRDAMFIHVVRDGRAVCESHYRMIRKHGWQTHEETWPEGWPDAWRERYQRTQPNPFAATVFFWMHMLSLVWQEKEAIPASRFLEVAYEDLVLDPERVLQDVQSFAGLRASEAVGWYVRNVPPENNNRKWRRSLTREQLDEFFELATEKRFLGLLRDDL